MQLLASWKDSLSLLKPANFKLFLLVTLKSLKDTYKVWLRYWGWLIIFVLFWELITRYTMGATSGLGNILMLLYGINKMIISFIFSGPFLLIPFIQAHLPGLSWLAFSYCMVFLLYITLFLSARASVKIKDLSYFKDYVVHALYLIVWFFLLSLLTLGYIYFLTKVLMLKGFMSELFSYFYTFLMTAWSAFFMLFVLDSDGQIKTVMKSVGRSLKLLIYNLPACLLLALMLMLFYIAGILVLVALLYVLPPNIILGKLFTIFFVSLLVCVATNYYIKRIYDQFNVYFESK